MMLSLVLIMIAGVCNSIMDTLQFHYGASCFSNLNPFFWDPKESWKNKWKNGDRSQGEKFFGSSTFLVCFTDAWHLFQTFMLLCFSFAIVLYSPMVNWWVDAIIYHAVFGIVFELFWSIIWKKN